jgi:ATP synthase protein I
MRFIGIGSELIVPILVGVYLGYRLDAWLGTGPWGLVGLSILGMVTGFVQFLRSVLPPAGQGSRGPDGRGEG